MFPLLVWGIVNGDDFVWKIILSVCSALSVYELVKMLVPALYSKVIGGDDSSSKHWIIFSCLGSVLLFNVFVQENHIFLQSVIPLFFTVMMLYGVFTAKKVESSVVRLIGTVTGIVYGCLPWVSVWLLFKASDGGKYLLFLIFVVMACDTGAYFGGKSFGKRKMSKNLSPNKTWEGLITGLVMASLVGVLTNYMFSGALGNYFVIALISFTGALAGVLGDLVESGFKRFSGVKDSGRVLPGHGGFLDRVDAILFAAPVVWFLLLKA